MKTRSGTAVRQLHPETYSKAALLFSKYSLSIQRQRYLGKHCELQTNMLPVDVEIGHLEKKTLRELQEQDMHKFSWAFWELVSPFSLIAHIQTTSHSRELSLAKEQTKHLWPMFLCFSSVTCSPFPCMLCPCHSASLAMLPFFCFISPIQEAAAATANTTEG